MFDLVLPRRVLARRQLCDDAVVLRLERRQDAVRAGRHIAVGLPGESSRAYSVYSGERDPWLEILVRRVAGGQVSPRLWDVRPGDRLEVGPPKGRFGLAKAHPFERLLLLATGTGVAPFRAFVLSHPELDYLLVHGTRTPVEDFAADFAPPARRVHCVSAPPADWVPGDHQRRGRLTSWLAEADLARVDRAYLCGNARMMVEAVPILVDKGLEDGHIHTETYF